MSHWRPLLIISIEKQLTWQVCDDQELIKGGRRRLICAPWAHLSAISYFNRNQSERVLKFPCPSQLCSERWPFNRAMLLRLNIHEASCWRSLCSCSPLSVRSRVNSSKTKPPITQSICSSLTHARGKFPQMMLGGCINLSAGAILLHLISSWLGSY
jgi:hypothetical protein